MDAANKNLIERSLAKYDCEIFDERIYIYKNFLNINYYNIINKDLNSFKDEQWINVHYNYEIGDLPTNLINKLSPDIHNSLNYLWNEITNLVAPDYWPIKHFNFTRLLTGDKTNYTSIDENLINKPVHKVYYYAGDWTGGEILFGNKDKKYNPNANDLIIVDINIPISVNEVLSGVRYSYLDYLYQHPGWIVG